MYITTPYWLLRQAVLYGIFPAVLLGAALSWAYMKRRRAPMAKLVAGHAAGEASVVLKDVYRFKDVYEVRGVGALHQLLLFCRF
jgi:hypothetical protein